MKYLIILLTITISLNAKIIEVEQLFNKTLVSVKEKDISLKKSFYGKTAINESSIVDINTRFSGFIHKLFANNSYMYIDKNIPLFSIYSDEIVAAQEELHLAKKLKKNTSIYTSALNKLKSLDLSEETLSKIKNSPKVIENINVYSPINGFLIKKSVNDKSFVKEGTLIFRVADFSKLWFIASVYQKDISFISKGMMAKVNIEGIDKPIDAKVDYIYPTIDEKKQTIDIRVLIDNKKLNLYPNMFAKVDLFQVQKSMLTLPRSAVLTKGEKHYVFKPLDDKEFKPVEVTAKRIDSKVFEIVEGLSAGEKVIDKVLFMLDSDAITNGLYSSDDEDW